MDRMRRELSHDHCEPPGHSSAGIGELGVNYLTFEENLQELACTAASQQST
jgi:hypothetical protein